MDQRIAELYEILDRATARRPCVFAGAGQAHHEIRLTHWERLDLPKAEQSNVVIISKICSYQIVRASASPNIELGCGGTNQFTVGIERV